MSRGRPPREILDSSIVGDYGIFRVRRIRSRSGKDGEVREYHAVDAPDWVNVVPATADGRLVMVEQYRHAAAETTLEFPAGLVEEGEDGVAAGLRELEEETGFVAVSSRLLGKLRPNPAINSNTLWVVAAAGCTPTGTMDQDDGEDVRTRLVEATEVPALIRAGRITHALTVAVWLLYEQDAAGRAAAGS
jgi:ADP-ribose pyrophosphatase